MKYVFSSLFFSFILFVMASCEDATDGYDDIVKPNGQVAAYDELSAGSSTVFLSSNLAYDTPSNWVTGSVLSRFNNGDQLYNDARNSSSDMATGGLGPVYGGYSCGSCHNKAGRTASTLYTAGGSGIYGFSSMLVYITRKNGKFFRQYGRVLHDNSIVGVKPEGKVSVTFTEIKCSFPDGETYSLIRPHYSVSEWYADSIKPEDLWISVRIPLRHVGMGQIMNLDQDELVKLAAQSNYPVYGISGRLNYVTERGKYGIAVGGNKANHRDLTVELGFSSDMGVTNSRYPEEVCQGQAQWMHGVPGLQVSSKEMENVDLYLCSLGVPARRNVNNSVVRKGEKAFYACKCQLCHTPTLHTKSSPLVLLNGSSLPWLAGQTIHPYSDFLIHDMGPDLDDHMWGGLASGREWRTTPLWGIGLQYTVNGHTEFLHDGRARNLKEAILWHGGEGEFSRELFKRLDKSDRDALIVFLESL
jgi:CxxC motif-containing protein (DUF1111 family)